MNAENVSVEETAIIASLSPFVGGNINTLTLVAASGVRWIQAERQERHGRDAMNNVRNVAPEIRTGAYELTIVI